MQQQILEIPTDVFRVLRQKTPGFVAWAEEKPGPTQRILVGYEVYTELIDRAIAKRQPLDVVIREFCARN